MVLLFARTACLALSRAFPLLMGFLFLLACMCLFIWVNSCSNRFSNGLFFL